MLFFDTIILLFLMHFIALTLSLATKNPLEECCKELFITPPKDRLELEGTYKAICTLNNRYGYKLDSNTYEYYLYYLEDVEPAWIIEWGLIDRGTKGYIRHEGNEICPSEVENWESYWTPENVIDPDITVNCQDRSKDTLYRSDKAINRDKDTIEVSCFKLPTMTTMSARTMTTSTTTMTPTTKGENSTIGSKKTNEITLSSKTITAIISFDDTTISRQTSNRETISMERTEKEITSIQTSNDEPTAIKNTEIEVESSPASLLDKRPDKKEPGPSVDPWVFGLAVKKHAECYLMVLLIASSIFNL